MGRLAGAAGRDGLCVEALCVAALCVAALCVAALCGALAEPGAALRAARDEGVGDEDEDE